MNCLTLSSKDVVTMDYSEIQARLGQTMKKLVNFDAKVGDVIRWDLQGSGGHCVRTVIDTYPNHVSVKSNDRSSGYAQSYDYLWLQEVKAYYVD